MKKLMEMKRKVVEWAVGVFSAVVAAPAFATAPTSIIDYADIMTAVTTELSAGVALAAAVVGLIWGAKIGVRFVRSLLH